jgi:uncharacterized protein YajQ (UPF0234 family)
MAKNFSFDVVSNYDASEMNNVVDQARREIANRYDFKGTSAAVEFATGDKDSLKITGDNQYHLDAIMDMLRKKAATRGVSQKLFDTTAEPETSNMKTTWIVSLKKGLDQQKAKKITKLLRDKLPKVKTQIQGEEVRVTSPKKDELQAAMDAIKKADFDFPVSFQNLK